MQPRPMFALSVEQVAALARRYCELIESSSQERPHWLREIATLLPRLHAAMTWLCAEAPATAHAPPEDLDARFELFSRLHALLADRDGYWLEFDRSHDGMDTMTGSLADDLTDIYCELREGLRLFPRDPATAVATWSTGYDHHWNRHLIDAERHLALLASQGRLAA